MRKLKIYIYQGDDKLFRFRVRSGNGEIIAYGEGYQRERDCLDTVEALQSHLAQADLILETKS